MCWCDLALWQAGWHDLESRGASIPGGGGGNCNIIKNEEAKLFWINNFDVKQEVFFIYLFVTRGAI